MISVGRVVFGTIRTMVVIIMMAYPLSKRSRELPRTILMWVLVFCMLFNGGTIPWFITMQKYGLIDNLAALIFAGSVPVFNVLLLMNFFRNLPADHRGSRPCGRRRSVAYPVADRRAVLRPGYCDCRALHLGQLLNEYFQGLVLMNSEDKYPLQTYIRQITVQIPANVTLTTEQYQQLAKNSNKALEAAKVFIAMIPMLIVYPFLQNTLFPASRSAP